MCVVQEHQSFLLKESSSYYFQKAFPFGLPVKFTTITIRLDCLFKKSFNLSQNYSNNKALFFPFFFLFLSHLFAPENYRGIEK